MSMHNRNGCSSDQDELDDLHSPTDVSEDSIEVKVRPIPIRNKRKCTEPRHNPQTSHKKLILDPAACGIGNEKFHHWYPRQQEEPLALVLCGDSTRRLSLPLGTVNHHEVLSRNLCDVTSKEDSDVVICTSVSDSAISSRLGSQPCTHTTARSEFEESHSPQALSPTTQKIKYLVVKDSVSHNDSASSTSQSDMSTSMFMSCESGFLDSGFIRHPLHRNENVRSNVLLQKTTETSGFPNECSKEIKIMLLHGVLPNQDMDSMIKVQTSLLHKSRKERKSLNVTSNEDLKTLNNRVYPLVMYPKQINSEDLNNVSDHDSSATVTVRQHIFSQIPGVSETSKKPYNSQVEMKSLSVSDCGEDLRKNSVCNFSVESLLGNGEQILETNGLKSAQRNYKNMTRERRIEANARERTRVHTISAAFDTLRRAIPAYSHNQKLSKLSVLRIACSYILTLSRIAGYDYSADQSQPTLPQCIDSVSRTIQTEGKLRRKKDDQ